MKKIYTLLSLAVIGSLALSNKAAAQITVTDADMPTIGTSFSTAYDTTSLTLKTISPGAKGANGVWNYSALIATYNTSDVFVDPASTPYAASFSGANLADSSYGTVGYNYISSTSSAFEIIGSEQDQQGNMVAVKFNPPVTEIKLPAHYGDINSGQSTAVIPAFAYSVAIYDSVKGNIQVTYTDTIDAYGTLTTPLLGGTAYNVLRQKHYEHDIDSIFVHSTGGWQYFPPVSANTKTLEYRYYTNGLGDLAGTLQVDTTNTKVLSFQWYNGKPVGINELSHAHFTLAYPNPTTRQISFRYSAQNAQYILVYDMAGRQIGQVEMKNGMATLNTSAFAGGIYFYHVTDRSGNMLDNGKFSVL